MKIFLDSADLTEIKAAVKSGLIDGLTTNPSLAAKNSQPFSEVVNEIFNIVNGPISLEVISTDYEQILEEGRKLAALNSNVVVKIPMIPEGLMAVKKLAEEGIKTNVTLIFSATQALLAAKAGATYVSPFVGRLHDIGQDGMELIINIRQIFDNYQYQSKILVASDRTVMDTLNSALIGADVITIKYENFLKLFQHPLTDIGLKKFMQDWEKSGQKKLV